MHNYLLMGHLLQCQLIPKDEVHPELWVGANKKFRKVPRARLEKVRNDKVSVWELVRRRVDWPHETYKPSVCALPMVR